MYTTGEVIPLSLIVGYIYTRARAREALAWTVAAPALVVLPWWWPGSWRACPVGGGVVALAREMPGGMPWRLCGAFKARAAGGVAVAFRCAQSL